MKIEIIISFIAMLFIVVLVDGCTSLCQTAKAPVSSEPTVPAPSQEINVRIHQEPSTATSNVNVLMSAEIATAVARILDSVNLLVTAQSSSACKCSRHEDPVGCECPEEVRRPSPLSFPIPEERRKVYVGIAFLASIVVRALLTCLKALPVIDAAMSVKPSQVFVAAFGVRKLELDDGDPAKSRERSIVRLLRRISHNVELLLRYLLEAMRKGIPIYGTLFVGGGTASEDRDYLVPLWLGMLEAAAYPILIYNQQYVVIGAWIGFKGVAQWRHWADNRTVFNRFLLGNAGVVCISVYISESIIAKWLAP